MFKRYLIILLISLVLPVALPTLSAQGTPSRKCDVDYMHTVVASFIEALKPLIDKSDPVAIATSLQDLAESANIMKAVCDGLAFSDKKQKLIGPVEFPIGTYRVTAKTAGYMIVVVTPAQGQCGHGQYMEPNLFLIIDGQATDGAETLFVSQGCTAMVEVSNVQGDWSLSFDNLSTNK